MRRKIQIDLPSFDDLKSEVRAARPTEHPRAMKVIQASAPVRKVKAAAYCRVSTDMEDQKSSIAIQQEHFTSEAAKHEDWELVGIYADVVSGTKKEKRPELQRLLADCEAGRVNLVVTKSISRFARNTADLLEMVRCLTAKGTEIFFEREKIDTRTMNSEFLLTILASLAEDESHSISGNCRWSLQERFEAGTYRAASAPYGYDLADGSYAVNEAEAAVVREIFARASSGEAFTEIAAELNKLGIPTKRAGQRWRGEMIRPKWEGDSIRTILRNASYTGDQLLQKRFTDRSFQVRRNRGQYPQYYHKNHHPAIIDRATFEAAQEILAQNQRKCASGPGQVTILSGMLVCSHCGSHLTRQINHGGNIYWVCRRHRRRAADCPLESIKETDFISNFEQMITELRADDRPVQEHLETLRRDLQSRPEVRRITARLTEIRTEIKGFTCTRERLQPAEYQLRINALSRERESLEMECSLMMDNRIARSEELLKLIHSRSGSFDFERSFRKITDGVTIYGRGEYLVNLQCGLVVKYERRE